MEGGDGKEEAQRGMKRAAFGERRVHQEEHPQEVSISKYVCSLTHMLRPKTQLGRFVYRSLHMPGAQRKCLHLNDGQRKMFFVHYGLFFHR